MDMLYIQQQLPINIDSALKHILVDPADPFTPGPSPLPHIFTSRRGFHTYSHPFPLTPTLFFPPNHSLCSLTPLSR